MSRTQQSASLDAALSVEFGSDPSPAAAARIDRRVAAALSRSPGAVAGEHLDGRPRLRSVTLAPIAALIAAVALGAVAVAAALVVTAEDQAVYDLTACMHARGWEVADPNAEQGTGHVVPEFSTTVDDSRQPAFNADLEECATNAGIRLER